MDDLAAGADRGPCPAGVMALDRAERWIAAPAVERARPRLHDLALVRSQSRRRSAVACGGPTRSTGASLGMISRTREQPRTFPRNNPVFGALHPRKSTTRRCSPNAHAHSHAAFVGLGELGALGYPLARSVIALQCRNDARHALEIELSGRSFAVPCSGTRGIDQGGGHRPSRPTSCGEGAGGEDVADDGTAPACINYDLLEQRTTRWRPAPRLVRGGKIART